VARRTVRLGAKRARFAAGHARGVLAAGRRLTSPRHLAADDTTVVQRIRSDALRTAGVSTKDVAVEVEDGVVTLRGTVEGRSTADELVAQVTKVPGVREVAAILRVSNEQRAA
jgi:osmotically-inducible protein OsmY